MWTCQCHQRPHIHRAIRVDFTQADYRHAWAEAEKMERTYEQSKYSDYWPNPKWTHRGPLAERVLAHQFNLEHTPYHDVGEEKVNAESDVEFGLELQATGHWKTDRIDELCLSIKPKERRKVAKADSVWVLASVDAGRGCVYYWGYRKGPSIRLADEPFMWQTTYGDPKRRLALVYPDELAPAEWLWAWLERRSEGRVSWSCGCTV